jgi:uncharacterized membrane protein
MTTNITDVANHIDIVIAPLLTSGIIGTTLSVTIFSHLVDTEYRKNTYAVLAAACCFALSSFCTLCYINNYENMNILRISRWLLQSGVIFIITCIFPLYKMTQSEEYARETEQIPDSNTRLSPEYVNSMSP